MTEIEVTKRYGGFKLICGETLEHVNKEMHSEVEIIEVNSLKDAISNFVDEMIFSKGYTFDAFTLNFSKKTENIGVDVDTVTIDGDTRFVKFKK